MRPPTNISKIERLGLLNAFSNDFLFMYAQLYTVPAKASGGTKVYSPVRAVFTQTQG